MINNGQIRGVFETICSGLKFDHTLFKKVCKMEAHFVNKREDHIAFFGGAVTGVQVVRFTDADRDVLFTDILDANDDEIENALYALRDHSGKPVINPDWQVSSDIFNIASVYLMHGFRISHLLSEDEKVEAQVRVCCYLLYKYITSLMFKYFKFPADPEVAQAAYSQLTYKFILKQLGSWGATIRYMAENAIAKESIHYKTIEKMDDDTAVLYVVTNLQGNCRDMMKNIMSEIVRVHNSGTRITSASALIESDGEMVLKESSKNPGVYAKYLKTLIGDKNSFIKQELIDVVCNIMHTLSPRMLTMNLVWISEHYQSAKNKDVDTAIDLVLEHALEYTSVHRELLHADLATLVDRLRGAYMSSRSSDEKLLEIRKLMDKIAKASTGSTNETALGAVRTGSCLYCVIRAYSRQHYSNQ